MSRDAEPVVEAVARALAAAGREEQWPDQLQLPDAVDELALWLGDERQWASGSQRNWASLINDVIAALHGFGVEVQRVTYASALCDQLEQCRAMIRSGETRSDPALRRRLRRLVDTIRERFRGVEGRLA